MRKVKVVSPAYTVRGFPFISTLTILLSLDHWNASDVIRGVVYAALVILWIASIIKIFTIDMREPVWQEKRKDA